MKRQTWLTLQWSSAEVQWLNRVCRSGSMRWLQLPLVWSVSSYNSRSGYLSDPNPLRNRRTVNIQIISLFLFHKVTKSPNSNRVKYTFLLVRSWPCTFTVDGDCSLRILADVQELGDDDIIGRAAVHKEQIMMTEAHICETFGVVHFLVETDDGGDVVLPEVREIRFGGVKRVSWWTHKYISLFHTVWAHKTLEHGFYRL